MSAEDYRQMARAIVWLHGSDADVLAVEIRNREVEEIRRNQAEVWAFAALEDGREQG